MRELPHEELVKRAKRLKLVLSDNDGVLTDTGVYYSERGEEMKRYSIRDGMGVERLRNNGVETAIITGESSPSVRRRAEKLQMPFLYLGVKHKLAHIELILKETGFAIDELAYIGDDVNDLKIMEEIGKAGILACPCDAMQVVQDIVNYKCAKPGGNGAFRDFAEWILTLRNH
ncbi:MAG: HAD-IIIA family hydrolase [Chlorobiales bacterium]|nr:HAD-IIIA family hydrolase [Chlorobiales bacterium]